MVQVGRTVPRPRGGLRAACLVALTGLVFVSAVLAPSLAAADESAVPSRASAVPSTSGADPSLASAVSSATGARPSTAGALLSSAGAYPSTTGVPLSSAGAYPSTTDAVLSSAGTGLSAGTVLFSAAAHPSSAGAGPFTTGGGRSASSAAVACPGQSVPPGPPADEENRPVPPLPVPDAPVGGPAMGTCADVRAAGVAPPPQVGVAGYVVADLTSGAVLAVRAPHARERPASTLKLLLGLVVTDRLDPAQVVVGTDEDANVDGSRAGVGPGGRYTVEQLLTGLYLNSGNDCANALARTLGGIPATLALMQDEARRLGALDTRPATPSGLDGPGMSASAYDLALIFRQAAARPRIATVLRTRTAPFPGFGGKPGFLTSNQDPLLDDPGVIGGKTGFTDAARHTFVGAVDRGGRRLVVVLMRGEQRPVRMVDSARALLDWGFTVPRTATPVGTLVDPAPDAPPSTGDAVTNPEPGAAGADAGPSLGSILVSVFAAIAVLAVAVAAVLRFRRR